jgi:nucleoside-diphosphate-sugar epimerase
VYPSTKGPHREDDYIPADATGGGVYGMTKLMSEAIISQVAKDPLILRPVFLLGADSRPGNLVRVLTDAKPSLDLSGKSTFNCVLHSDILAFLELALRKNLSGIYNAASNDAISLAAAAKIAGKKAAFGKGLYEVPAVDNEKIKAVCPVFDQTSEDAIARFLHDGRKA